MKKIFLATIILAMIIIAGCGVSDVADQIANVSQATDEHVLGVKKGHPFAYPDITYEQAFENFFGSPTWKYFIGTKDGPDDNEDGKPDYTEDNADVVEFTGYCTYSDVKVKALIQFTLSEEDDTFGATYLSFNAVPQTNLMLNALIEKAFDEYQSTHKRESTDNGFSSKVASNSDLVNEGPDKVNICLYKNVYDFEKRKETYKEVLNVDFPMTVKDARDITNNLPTFYFNLAVEQNQNILHCFPDLKNKDFKYTKSDPSFFFAEEEYNDYDWNYGTPSSTYCNMFEYGLGDSYDVVVNGDVLVKDNEIVSKDTLVSLYGKYETLDIDEISYSVFKISKDVYLVYWLEMGRFKLVYPHLSAAHSGENNVHFCEELNSDGYYDPWLSYDEDDEYIDSDTDYNEKRGDYSALKYAGEYRGPGGFEVAFSPFTADISSDCIGVVDLYYEGECIARLSAYSCDEYDYYDNTYRIQTEGYEPDYLGFYIENGVYVFDYITYDEDEFVYKIWDTFVLFEAYEF